MATHDYVIANQSGAAFRTDLNNALAAIVSNNSNSSSPATTYAYQWWADTSAGVLKIRNSANNAWIELLQLDGTLTLEDGSASTPALAFRDDLNTGIFSSAADTFNVATGGVGRLEISTSAVTFNESGADVDFRIEGDTNTHLFFVDAGNDKIGFGTSSITDGVYCFNAGTANGVANFISSDAGAVINITDNSARSSIEQNGTDLKIISDTGDADASSTIKLQVDASTKMTILSSGAVGIGTTSPSEAIHVTGGHGAGVLAQSGGTTSGGLIRMQNTQSGTQEFYFGVGGGANNFVDGRGLLLRDVTQGATRLVVLTSGNVGIGVIDPDKTLEVNGGVAGNGLLIGRANNVYPVIQRHTAGAGSQTLTITGGAGLSEASTSAPTFNDALNGAAITLGGGNPTSDTFGGGINYYANGSTSPNNPSTGNQHVFYVRTAANTLTEKMRLDHHGGLRINTTSVNLADELFSITEPSTDHEIAGFRVNNASHTKNMVNMAHVADSGDRIMFKFMRTGSLSQVGRIVTSASTTTFDTNSDYRLKENEVLISDGITRLKTLKPYRFNFKIEPDKTVDGFFAHEVSSAVPEAITGVKDAVETTYYTNGDTIPDGKAVGDVKEENAILPQGLDYSKFTPLLTAALQEAISKIEVLETKVAALEAA